MRGQLVNELQLALRVTIPAGARLLVAEDVRQRRHMPDGRGYDVTVSVKTGTRPYLPGSSIKGALRSRAEFIANTLNQHGPGTCHLFAPYFDSTHAFDSQENYERMACDKRFNLRIAALTCAPAGRYKDACPACQLFGHSHYAGRLRVSDFLAQEMPLMQMGEQPGIAVDRVTGGVIDKRLYHQEFLTRASFKGLLTIENYSLWQAGWLGMLLQDLRDGLLRVGHKTTSGAGKLAIEEARVTLKVVRGYAVAENRVMGAGALVGQQVRDAYGYAEDGPITVPGVTWGTAGFWQESQMADGQTLWQAARPYAARYLGAFAFDQETMSVNALRQLVEPQPAA